MSIARLICSLVVLCLLLSVPSLGEKYKIDPDSVKLFSKDADSPYQVLGVVGTGTDCADSSKIVESLIREFEKKAAKMGGDAVIFTRVIYEGVNRFKDVPLKKFLSSAASVSRPVALGVCVKSLDSAEAAAWELSHPIVPRDKDAPIDVMEGDVDRRYKVKGVAFGLSFGELTEDRANDVLRKYAQSMQAQAVIFTEYEYKGFYYHGPRKTTAIGVAVRYVK